MKDYPYIGIVIVTHNGLEHLHNLLPSIFSQQDYPRDRYHVCVVDNRSLDDTTSFVQSIYPQIHLVSLPKNLGFAEPNNIGISEIFKKFPLTDKIVFLNNDTVIPKTFLSTLVAGFVDHPNAGSIQTKISSFSDAKIIDSVGIEIDQSMSAINKGQGEIDEGQYDNAFEIFGTTGSAMMISKKALEAIDLGCGEYFDNLYFAYQEDVDLAWRLRSAGFTSWYVPGEEVRHIHSATGKSYSAFKSFHIHRNTLYTIVKNMPFPLVFLTLGYFCLRYKDLIMSVFKKKGPSYEVSKKVGVITMIGIVIKSWASLIWYMPKLLVKRRTIKEKMILLNDDIKKLFKKFKADENNIIYSQRTQ